MDIEDLIDDFRTDIKKLEETAIAHDACAAAVRQKLVQFKAVVAYLIEKKRSQEH